MAESFSREKLRHAPQKEGDEKSCVTPAGTSNELDVQNECEETHTHTHTPNGQGGENFEMFRQNVWMGIQAARTKTLRI